MYEYLDVFCMYDTRKSVGCKERLTRTLELLLLFASYTCLYVTRQAALSLYTARCLLHGHYGEGRSDSHQRGGQARKICRK